MDKNIITLIVSFVYIAILLVASVLLRKFTHIKGINIRKGLHILSSLWVFALIYGMDDLRYMIIGPLAFIFINALIVFSKKGEFFGEERGYNSGLVYFPVSLLIIVILYGTKVLSSYSVMASVLIMGISDGGAAIIGVNWGKHTFMVYKRYQKSIEGTLFMFISAFLIALFSLPFNIFWAFLISAGSTVVELITPSSFDNLSVPLITAAISEVLVRAPW